MSTTLESSADPAAPPPLSLDALVASLSVRDLTDVAAGPHAMQLLLDDVVVGAQRHTGATARIERSRPVVSVEDNYDRLGYPGAAAARDARYTRYVSATTMLRSHTSAGVPPLLRAVAAEEPPRTEMSSIERVLLVVPGICHRRDSIDRIHTGTPHQVDVWLLQRGGHRLDHDDLHELVGAVVDAALPGRHWRWTATTHPYTTGGRQVDVIGDDGAVEVAECGLAAPDVLAAAGLDPSQWSGLALGSGLDRLLMLRKRIPDIRLLRSADPRVAAQLLDLQPYRPVSDLPPASRDVSIAVAAGDDNEEILGDRVREALGSRADLVEEVSIVSRTPYAELPAAAAERLGMTSSQVNLLVRINLRPADRTLDGADVNDLRDRIYAALHAGHVPPDR